MAAAAASAAPGLTYVNVDDVEPIVNGLRKTFRSGRTLEVAWRKRQLEGIHQLLVDNSAAIAEAIGADLRRPSFETLLAEVTGVIAEVKFALSNVDAWVKPHGVSTPLTQKPASSEQRYEPYGVCLLIGPWNFPVSLILQPLISALAAGNCVLIKPSEVSYNTAALLQRIIPKYVDTAAVQVVQGAVKETTALLKLRFDHIFYTGNGMVGRIVMAAAAKHLTPVTLELGGKTPCIVDNSHSDFGVVARRVLAGKLLNCGQVCIAPDYILVTTAAHSKFINACKKTLQEFYGSDPQKSADLGRIVNERHFDRVKALLDSHTGQIAHGGRMDRSDLFIEPTLLTDVSLDSKIMQDEIFGPLLPIVPVKTVDEAIDFVNARDKPLALYLFSSSNAVKEKVLKHTSSGGVCVNDTLFHIANPHLPFGGVGPSGTGSYHGFAGFKAFSHERSVMSRATWIDPAIRYPPYTDGKRRMAEMMLTGIKVPKAALIVAAAAGTAGAYYMLRSRL